MYGTRVKEAYKTYNKSKDIHLNREVLTLTENMSKVSRSVSFTKKRYVRVEKLRHLNDSGYIKQCYEQTTDDADDAQAN